MKILVTGGSGMVGSSLKEHIKYFYHKLQDNFLFLSSSDYNLLNYDDVYILFNQYEPDIVIHLAANVGGLYKNLNDNINMFQDNLLMNMNIFKACYKFNIKKLITIGSTCIFPDKTSYPLKENMLHNGEPHSSNYGYSFAKRMLDVMTTLYNKNSSMDCIHLIPCNLYGKYDNFNLENSHVIPGLIHKFYLAKINNTDIKIKGSGIAKRQFLFVDDFCDIICKCIFNNIQQKSIIVCPTKEYSIKDIVNKISKIIDFKNKIIYQKNFSDGQIKKTACNDTLCKQFGDINFTSVNDGLNETIHWFLENYKNVRK
jgi:GDP-L-fucose synthase